MNERGKEFFMTAEFIGILFLLRYSLGYILSELIIFLFSTRSGTGPLGIVTLYLWFFSGSLYLFPCCRTIVSYNMVSLREKKIRIFVGGLMEGYVAATKRG